jgi:hypothetical protein
MVSSEAADDAKTVPSGVSLGDVGEPRTKPGRARLGAQGPGRVKTGSFSASVEN